MSELRLCVQCRVPVKDPQTKRCRSCFLQASGPSPLREWRASTGTSLHALAASTGLPVRTVMRVASGRAASGRVAVVLSRATGLDVVTLLRGRFT